MSALQRGIRQASRSLPQRFCRSSALRPLSSCSSSTAAAAPRSAPLFCHTRNTFSTMASLQSAAAATPSSSESKGYDPEIKDIADYVHNKAIDSELAVSAHAYHPE